MQKVLDLCQAPGSCRPRDPRGTQKAGSGPRDNRGGGRGKTAQEILDESTNVVQVVLLTPTVRPFGSEVEIQADESNGLESDSAAQCQHIRSVSVDRVESLRGKVGAAALTEIRDVLGLILDIN